jgi:hypothetical protein
MYKTSFLMKDTDQAKHVTKLTDVEQLRYLTKDADIDQPPVSGFGCGTCSYMIKVVDMEQRAN